MTAELAERELRVERIRQRRRRRTAEIADLRPLQRSRRITCPRRLPVVVVEADGRLTRWMGGSTISRSERLVPRSDRAGHIQAARHGTRRLGPRRASSPRRGRIVVKGCALRPRSRSLAGAPRRAPCQGRVRLVDFRHLARGEPRRLRVVPGQVGVMLPSEATPGRLDLGGSRTRLDAEDDKGFAFGHGESVAPARRPAGLPRRDRAAA